MNKLVDTGKKMVSYHRNKLLPWHNQQFFKILFGNRP